MAHRFGNFRHWPGLVLSKARVTGFLIDFFELVLWYVYDLRHRHFGVL